MESIFSLNQDSVVYAIRQAIEARTKPQGVFNSHLRYVPFLENTWKYTGESSTSALKTPLSEIFQHHFRVIPHYARHDKVSIETIAWFSLSMATLFADIDYLLNSILGQSLPMKDETDEKSNEIWSLVNEIAKNELHEYAEMFEAYANWKYTTIIVKTEPVDWNVRPPCGVLYKSQFKELFAERRFGSRGSRDSKDSRNSRDSKPKEQGGSEAEKSRDSGKRNQGKFEGSTGKSRHDKSDNRDRRGRPDNREQRDREPKRLHDTSPELLQAALDECKQAVETMKNNSNIHEISLSAQNSFIRRHQHTLITDAGFETDSRGDGATRHVCVLRKLSES